MKLSGLVVKLDKWLTGLFIILTGIPCLRGYSCGDDIQAEKNMCLLGYNAMITQASAPNFYTGIDVEEVRSICQAVIRSLTCTHNLKMNCPDTEHTDIEVTLAELLPSLKMCSSGNFYEVYARNQFCYMRTSVYSEHCYLEYQSNTESLVSDIYIGDPEAISNMCRNLDELISCISTNVKVNCNPEAAELVPLLVNPTVAMSENCHNETTTPRPTTRSGRTREPMVNDDNDPPQPAQESSLVGSTASQSQSSSKSILCIMVLLYGLLAHH